MTIPKAGDAANSPTSDGVNTITFLTTGRIVPNVPISSASTINAPETRHTTIQVQRVLGMRSMRAATAAGSVQPTANPPLEDGIGAGKGAARQLHERRPPSAVAIKELRIRWCTKAPIRIGDLDPDRDARD